MIAGVIGNMIVPIELIQRAIDPMVKKKFGRIVNITSGSVKMPLVGLDLSSGARAGLTAFLAGVARSVAQHNVTINFMLPGPFDTDRLRSNNEITAKKQGITVEQARRTASPRSGEAARHAGRVRRHVRVPVLVARRLHHRAEHADGRRDISGGVLMRAGRSPLPGDAAQRRAVSSAPKQPGPARDRSPAGGTQPPPCRASPTHDAPSNPPTS